MNPPGPDPFGPAPGPPREDPGRPGPGLVPVDAFVHDAEGSRAYRACDFCYGSAAEDLRDGWPPRRFYRDAHGAALCQHCLAAILGASPSQGGEAPMSGKPREQRYRADDGTWKTHREKPSRRLAPVKLLEQDLHPVTGQVVWHWENDVYYGLFERHGEGFPIGGGPWALISITARDETARHDFREFQQIKNGLVGREWEAVELYPAESRLMDPSNRFYLWCVPRGVFAFGFEHRRVLDMAEAGAPQRPLPPRKDPGRPGEGP